jgi:hypothetical protein
MRSVRESGLKERTVLPLGLEALAVRRSSARIAGQILLSRWLTQVLVGPPCLGGHHPGVLLDPLGLLEEEGLECKALNPLAPEKLGHCPAAHQRQVAAKQNPIEATERSPDLGGVLGDEGFHGGHQSPGRSCRGSICSSPRTTRGPQPVLVAAEGPRLRLQAYR